MKINRKEFERRRNKMFKGILFLYIPTAILALLILYIFNQFIFNFNISFIDFLVGSILGLSLGFIIVALGYIEIEKLKNKLKEKDKIE